MTVGLCCCVICKCVILESYSASFDLDGFFQIHEVPTEIAFSKHEHLGI
jgi:hypothetical protein